MNIYFQGNILIKNNSKYILPFLSNAYSLIKNEAFDYKIMYQPDKLKEKNEKYRKIIKNYIIINILKSINNSDNLQKLGLIINSDIFIDKNYSFNLLNNSYNEEVSQFLLNHICQLYCKGYYELLFIELLKYNIRNSNIIKTLISYFSENELKELFEKNKSLIIKSIYIYSQINEHSIVLKLLQYLEKYFGIKFVQNIIFPQKMMKTLIIYIIT